MALPNRRIDQIEVFPLTLALSPGRGDKTRQPFAYDHGHDYGTINQIPPDQNGGAWQTTTALTPVARGW